MPDAVRIRKFLIAARLTVGVSSLVMPRTFAKIMGIQPAANRSLSFLGRLFGVREALMAYQLYQASDEELEEVLRQGILVDGIDLVSTAASAVRGDISAQTFVMTAGAAGSAIAGGLLSRRP